MAIVKFPLGSPGENRSFTGATFTRNSSGSIIRARKKPLLKRTPATTQSRTNFRNVVSNYRLNTPSEKLGWSSKTPQFPRVNSLGEIYLLQGNQLFGSLNQNKVNEGDSINFTPQDAATFPARSIISGIMDIDPVDISHELDNNQVPANYSFSFWCTFVFNSIQSWSFPNDYKLIQTFDPGIYLQFDLSTNYQQIWGPGPANPPGNPMSWYIKTVLESTYLPSGEKGLLANFVSTIIQ